MKACATANIIGTATVSALMAFAGCAGTAPAESPTKPTDSVRGGTEATEAASDDTTGWVDSDGTESGENAEPEGASPSAARAPTETRTTEAIAKVIKDHRKGARACYEQVQKDVPGLRGDLVIQFVLRPSGAMKHAELNEARSTLKEPKLVNCVIDVLKHLEFPPSSRGMETKVNYPFNFVP